MDIEKKRKRGLATASCILGILSIPTLGLVLVGALTSVVLGVTALVKESRQPDEYGGRIAAIVGIIASVFSLLVTPVVGGIAAAIIIPSLLRARISANEATASKDLSTILFAESAYSRQNGGFFDEVRCLEQPKECLKAGRGTAPFLQVIPNEHAGYIRAFHAGGRASEEQIRAGGLSPTSIRSFALTSVPISQGQTGIRSFCTDDKGRYCLRYKGEEPAVADGSCQIEEEMSGGRWATCKARPDLQREE